MDIAGHVSRQMLKHYSHIRMEAKRRLSNRFLAESQTAEPSREESRIARCSAHDASKLKEGPYKSPYNGC